MTTQKYVVLSNGKPLGTFESCAKLNPLELDETKLVIVSEDDWFYYLACKDAEEDLEEEEYDRLCDWAADYEEDYEWGYGPGNSGIEKTAGWKRLQYLREKRRLKHLQNRCDELT